MMARVYFGNIWYENGESWFKVDLPFPCDIHMNYIDSQRIRHTPRGVVKVFIDSNEPTFYGQSVEDVLKDINLFDIVISKHSKIAEKHKNTVISILASSLVGATTSLSKTFSVSFLCTSKRDYMEGNTGYAVRHELWKRQREIRIHRYFWSSRFHPVDESRILPGPGNYADKIVLFNSMFSICPENSSEENYLTEKIMDCFLTMTVPIYRGCTNLENYFNPNGVILFTDIDDLIEKINKLTPDDYFNRMQYLKENYDKAITYGGFEKRVTNIIKKKINENSCINT